MSAGLLLTPAVQRARPRIGFIVPPAEDVVPPEATEMYGRDIDFVAVGLALARLTPEGYDAVQDKLVVAARRLQAMGVDALALMGTSLSFYKGQAYNQVLTELLQQASGLPAVTMSSAVVQALASSGCRSVAVATAYGEVVNQRLCAFLSEHGVEVRALEALAIEDVQQVHTVSEAMLQALGERALAAAPGADGLLISCGGLRTLGVSERLQAQWGLPVVSSSTAGPWAAVRLLGLPAEAAGAPPARPANTRTT